MRNMLVVICIFCICVSQMLNEGWENHNDYIMTTLITTTMWMAEIGTLPLTIWLCSVYGGSIDDFDEAHVCRDSSGEPFLLH